MVKKRPGNKLPTCFNFNTLF